MLEAVCLFFPLESYKQKNIYCLVFKIKKEKINSKIDKKRKMNKKHLLNLVSKIFIVLAGVWLVHQFVQLYRNTDFILTKRIGLQKINAKSANKERISKEQQNNVILLLTDYRTGSTLLVGFVFNDQTLTLYRARCLTAMKMLSTCSNLITLCSGIRQLR